MTNDENKPTCFIAMPITTHDHEADRYGDPDHWTHVMEHLFVPAIEAAGFTPIRPVTKGSDMIHGQIVKHLSEADMVLCDFSGLNANVFFELGVRTSLDKPVALVRDEHTKIPFDLGGMNSHSYKSALEPWSLNAEIESLKVHVGDCKTSCNGDNPLWQRFGLTIKAEEPSTSDSPIEAKIDLLLNEFASLRTSQREADAKPAGVSLGFYDAVAKREHKSSAQLSITQELMAESMNAIFAQHDLRALPEIYFTDGDMVVILERHEPLSKAVKNSLQEVAASHGKRLSIVPPA